MQSTVGIVLFPLSVSLSLSPKCPRMSVVVTGQCPADRKTLLQCVRAVAAGGQTHHPSNFAGCRRRFGRAVQILQRTTRFHLDRHDTAHTVPHPPERVPAYSRNHFRVLGGELNHVFQKFRRLLPLNTKKKTQSE